MAKEQPIVSQSPPRRCVFRLAPLVLLGSCLGGCQTSAETPPLVPPELVKAEDDLLKPLRARNIVIADRVLMQISSNFYTKIGRPPGGTRQAASDADEVVWSVRDPVLTRRQGAPGAPGTRGDATVPVGVSELEFVIEGTVFLVTDKLRLRILHNAPPTLQVSATGDVRLLTERAMQEKHFDELRFDQGKVYGRRAQN